MERKGEINESCVRFWTAELASACNYLHRQKIIHRSVRGLFAELIPVINIDEQMISTRSDLKPDNILLDAHGHVHLTDFNVAIHYSERRLHTSVAGSMAYMAPEILARAFFPHHLAAIVLIASFGRLSPDPDYTGKGYTWHVDYWSLGVCVFELLFGRRPFESRSADKLTQAIMRGTIKFPSGADEKCSKEGQDLVLMVSGEHLLAPEGDEFISRFSSLIATPRRG